MTKYKMLIAVILSAFIVISISPITYAHNSEDVICQNVLEEEKSIIDDASVEPRFICTYCQDFVPLVCYGEKRYFDESTHWTLFSGTCKVYYYESTSARRCDWCGRIYETFTGHLCEEIHVGCSKGTVDVCTCDKDMW